MNEATPPNRCRIVLIAPPLVTPEHICTAFDGGDVASLILPENGMDDAAFQAETIERLADRMMVGAGGAKTRDEALELGEERPDYMFFGRFGYDNKPEPHHRNLALGEWWAQMIQIPCIVMAGSELASVETVAATGAEFVALS
ncbi:thiamine phosphate synthase, partial [Mesorhizobium sp.]|uniref:thiamine phosphate synthase n=1 Tax=Mesorhizobium sp. TaxID=1871066 RepID=UPI000FE5C53D